MLLSGAILLDQLLIGERVDTRVDLGVWARKALTHDWDNLLLASR